MVFIMEFLPLLVFFLAFKFYGIYTATVVGIVIAFIQLLYIRLTKNVWHKQYLFTFFVFLVFGGMTLYFHNPVFVKWKPTIIFWVFALIALLMPIVSNKTLVEKLLVHVFENNPSIPPIIWTRLNRMWVIFFFALGAANLYIAHYFSLNTWVNFKFYGFTIALILFSVLQTLYLIRYINR